MSGSQSSLRKANRALVVDTVKRLGGLTQVELTAATGLSATTVSSIVKELLAGGVVDIRGTTRSGRRAQFVTIARRTGLAAGVHIGARHLRIALADIAHEIVSEQVLPLPAEHRVDTSLDRAALLVIDLLERVGSSIDELIGVGIGLSAPVDVGTGMISMPGIMRGWDDVHVAQVMAKRLARPVYVDNDANMAALAEARLGAAREYRDSTFVRVSYGVSAGIVINDQLHRGYAGTAGEIGHVQVKENGVICRCGGRGCLETVVGVSALLEPLRESHGNLTLRDVVTLAISGDAGCARVVADAGATVGSAVAALCAAVNPQCVVIGGELAETGEILLGPLRESIARRLVPNRIAPLRVVATELGTRSEVLGALTQVLEATEVSGVAQ